MRGTVKRFSKEKGYGFIVGNGGIRRCFHAPDTEGEFIPRVGLSVVFNKRENLKGSRAANVRMNPWSQSEGSKRVRTDRIDCPHCGMAIVPRMTFHYGYPTKSVCPFCAGIVRDFRKPVKPINWMGYLLTGLAIVIAFQLLFAMKSTPNKQDGSSTSIEQRQRG